MNSSSSNNPPAGDSNDHTKDGAPDGADSASERWQLFTSSGGHFSFRYPVMWEQEIIENVPSFYDPIGGKGAWQVATIDLPGRSDRDIAEIMRDYMAHVGIKDWAERARYSENGDEQMIALEAMHDQRFWFIVMKRRLGKTILGLYNGDEVPDPQTSRVLAKMAETLAVLD